MTQFSKLKIIVFFTIITSGFLVWGKAEAADYYVAQIGAGNIDASDCANAKAYNWDWTSPNVVAGDTVHLCGTFTSTLTIPQSFNAPGVTVKFEQDAIFSKAAWGTNSSAAIYINGKNNIIIDGNNFGVIENTDNGTALNTQQESYGIYINDASNITVKEMTVRTIYARTADSDDSNQYGRGIVSINNDNIVISDVDISDAYYAVYSYVSGGLTKSGFTVSDSNIHKVSTGIVVANLSGSTYSNVLLEDNIIYDLYYWDGCWGTCTQSSEWNHNDGIHTWGTAGAGGDLQITVRNNIIGGDFGAHTTSWVYLTDYTDDVEVYNNVLYTTAEAPAGGYMGFHTYALATIKIYNNTIVGASNTNTGGMGVYFSGSGLWSGNVQNNITKSVFIGVYDNTTNGSLSDITLDNNIYYNFNSVGRNSSAWYENLSEWQTVLGGCSNSGNDCNSLASDPLFVSSSDFNLQTGSPAINAGVDLSAYFTTDKLGNTRSGAWDIGAYEYTGASDMIAPTAPSGLSVQ